MAIKYPIGPLDVPWAVTLQHVEGWLNGISTYVGRLRETVEGLAEEQLGITYLIAHGVCASLYMILRIHSST